MAIIYSYPLADEVTNDSWVLGSEMDNGTRVVKNYSVGDLAAFIEAQVAVAPTLQNVTEEGANTTIQMQINGVDVATINDIPGIPTLQEVVAEGNTVTFSTGKTTINGGQIIVENTFTLKDTKILADKITMTNGNGGLKTLNILPPPDISANRNITFPNASGTIALTDNIPIPTLQQTTDEGNTTTNRIIITEGDGEVTIFEDGIDILNFNTQQNTAYLNQYIVNNTHQINIPNASGTIALVSVMTQGTIADPAASIPYDVMPYSINISVAPAFSHISLPTSNLTVGQEVYIQTINIMTIHGNPLNNGATTIFNSSGGSGSALTTTAGAFYKFTYLGVLDIYAPDARWVYQVLNQ